MTCKLHHSNQIVIKRQVSRKITVEILILETAKRGVILAKAGMIGTTATFPFVATNATKQIRIAAVAAIQSNKTTEGLPARRRLVKNA